MEIPTWAIIALIAWSWAAAIALIVAARALDRAAKTKQVQEYHTCDCCQGQTTKIMMSMCTECFIEHMHTLQQVVTFDDETETLPTVKVGIIEVER